VELRKLRGGCRGIIVWEYRMVPHRNLQVRTVAQGVDVRHWWREKKHRTVEMKYLHN